MAPFQILHNMYIWLSDYIQKGMNLYIMQHVASVYTALQHWYLSYGAGILHVVHSCKEIDCCAGLIPVHSLHAISYTIKFCVRNDY